MSFLSGLIVSQRLTAEWRRCQPCWWAELTGRLPRAICISGPRAHGGGKGMGHQGRCAPVHSLACSWHRMGPWQGHLSRANEADHAFPQKLPEGLLAEGQVWNVTAIFRATVPWDFAAISLWGLVLSYMRLLVCQPLSTAGVESAHISPPPDYGHYSKSSPRTGQHGLGMGR